MAAPKLTRAVIAQLARCSSLDLDQRTAALREAFSEGTAMSPTRGALASLLLATMLSCGDQAHTVPLGGSSAVTTSRDFTVSVDRSECYGWCPNYQLTIEGNGHVRYYGRSFVRDPGERDAWVSPDAAEGLLQQCEALHFLDLQDTYVQAVSDVSTTVLALTVGARSKRIVVHWGGGDPTGRRSSDEESRLYESLDALADAVDAAANVEQWIGTPVERRALFKGMAGEPGRTTAQ